MSSPCLRTPTPTPSRPTYSFVRQALSQTAQGWLPPSQRVLRGVGEKQGPAPGILCSWLTRTRGPWGNKLDQAPALLAKNTLGSGAISPAVPESALSLIRTCLLMMQLGPDQLRTETKGSAQQTSRWVPGARFKFKDTLGENSKHCSGLTYMKSAKEGGS